MTIELPPQFTFSVEQVAQLAGCSTDTILRNMKHYKPGDRYYLKARKNSNGQNSPYVVAALDLEDYLKRTIVGAEIILKGGRVWA